MLEEMRDRGLLEPPPLAEHISAAHSGQHLKDLAKKYGVPASGRKAQIGERLAVTVPEEMRKALRDFPMYVCSDDARRVAEAYQASAASRADAAEAASLGHIRARRFREASVTVARYEEGRVFPRGLGIDWSQHNPERDTEPMQEMFSRAPAILSAIAPDVLVECQVGAAMMNLWGRAYDPRWCPEAPATVDGTMPMDVAVRMVLFGANQRTQLQQFGKVGLRADQLRVWVGCVDDVRTCKTCRGAAGVYELDRIPEIPISRCTCEVGCRCTYFMVVGNFGR